MHSRPLLESEAAPGPFAQFAKWYADAAGVVRAPEAVALATSSGDCRPSARMVLMKGWDEAGFVFYTNYDSRKGRDLEVNPHAALLFHWDPLGRQVRIEGSVSRVAEGESDRYFASRPFGARIGAWASHQSEPVASRQVLDERVRELTALHGGAAGRGGAGGGGGGQVPRPEWWGGYRLLPDVFEFWQNRDDRLHDRLRYSRAGGSGWLLDRLQP